MTDLDLGKLRDLVALLKKEGVAEFRAGDLVVKFGPEVAITSEMEQEMRRLVRAGKGAPEGGNMNPYLDPDLWPGGKVPTLPGMAIPSTLDDEEDEAMT